MVYLLNSVVSPNGRQTMAKLPFSFFSLLKVCDGLKLPASTYLSGTAIFYTSHGKTQHSSTAKRLSASFLLQGSLELPKYKQSAVTDVKSKDLLFHKGGRRLK